MRKGTTHLRNLITGSKAFLPTGLLLLLLCASVALAQGGYSLPWFTISGGGGTSSAGPYTLSGTIGQTFVGEISGGPYTLASGFWPGTAASAPAPVIHIELTPEQAVNEVGTSHTVTATVQDDQGQPVADQALGFAVDGANSASGSGTTDANGQATFTYTGTQQGFDTITGWVDQNGDGVQGPDEPFDEARKEWGPTAVTLLSFTAHASADRVILRWQTAAEIDNEGFNLWRAEAADGPYTQINPNLIPAQGNPDTGASYEYVDWDVVKGVTYYYKLEDVDFHGVSTFHGPVSARPGPYRSIYLPLILK